MKSEPKLAQEKNRVCWKNVPQRRIEPTTLHQVGQRAQHITNEVFQPLQEQLQTSLRESINQGLVCVCMRHITNCAYPTGKRFSLKRESRAEVLTAQLLYPLAPALPTSPFPSTEKYVWSGQCPTACSPTKYVTNSCPSHWQMAQQRLKPESRAGALTAQLLYPLAPHSLPFLTPPLQKNVYGQDTVPQLVVQQNTMYLTLQSLPVPLANGSAAPEAREQFVGWLLNVPATC